MEDAIQWADNVKARNLADQEQNPYVKAEEGAQPLRSQTALYAYYKELSEK